MKLVEGIDYYVEDGKVVFTEDFLKKRGACCRNGCRHCPWKFKKDCSVAQLVARDAVNIEVSGSNPD